MIEAIICAHCKSNHGECIIVKQLKSASVYWWQESEIAKSFHLAPLFIDGELFRIQIIFSVMLKVLHYWLSLAYNRHIMISTEIQFPLGLYMLSFCSDLSTGLVRIVITKRRLTHLHGRSYLCKQLEGENTGDWMNHRSLSDQWTKLKSAEEPKHLIHQEKLLLSVKNTLQLWYIWCYAYLLSSGRCCFWANRHFSHTLSCV